MKSAYIDRDSQQPSASYTVNALIAYRQKCQQQEDRLLIALALVMLLIGCGAWVWA